MHTFEIFNGHERVTCDAAAMNDTCARLFPGGPLTIHETKDGVTRAVLIEGRSPAEITPAPVVQAIPVAIAPAPGDAQGVTSSWTAPVIVESAKVRIDGQQAALRAAGFTGIGHKATGGDGEQFYANGTALAAEGKTRMGELRAEHDRDSLLGDAIVKLANVVRAEDRRDLLVTAGDIARSVQLDGHGVTILGGYRLTSHAIRGLIDRCESPAWTYLTGLRDRMAEELARGDKADRGAIDRDRAEVARVLAYECARRPDADVKVRARAKGANGRPDVFACTSHAYANADAPESCGELAGHLPGDARGSWSYDPVTTSWELRANVWTSTPTAEIAVGEPFKGYASFRGRDNGTGRWNGGGGIELTRCLNASTYTADGVTVSRVHRGDVLRAIDRAVKGAIKAIDTLCAAWGRARTDVVAVPEGVTIEQAIPGFYRSLLDRRTGELAVLKGRTETHVAGLARDYWGELRHPGDRDAVTRADLAQGWTRYAQRLDAATRGDAETAIGSWLVTPSRVSYAPTT